MESYIKKSLNVREARQIIIHRGSPAYNGQPSRLCVPSTFVMFHIFRYTRININFTTNCIIRQWLISSYSIITLTWPLTLIQWVSSINVPLEIKNIISSMISIFSNNSCFQSKWLIGNSTINEVIIHEDSRGYIISWRIRLQLKLDEQVKGSLHAYF